MPKKIKPELWIFYNNVYSDIIRRLVGMKAPLTEKHYAVGVKYRTQLRKVWDKIERKAFDTLSKVSGLEWHRPLIECHLIRNITPFSMPLTIPMFTRSGRKVPPKDQIGTIIHELTHVLLVSNYDKLKKINWSKKYGKLSEKTEIHIMVDAILALAYPIILGKKQTEKEIEFDKSLDNDFAKAWQIVEAEGPENIIKKMIKK